MARSSTGEDREAVARVLRAVVRREVPVPADVERAVAVLPARLLPLVAEVARGVEASTARRLEQANREAAVAWLIRQRTVDLISDTLRAGGVDAVFLKGVALAACAYPRPPLRPMSDVDVWVDPSQWTAAHDLLLAAGLVVPPRHAPGAHGMGTRTAVLEDRRAPKPVLVELHDLPASLASVAPGAVRDLWARRRHVGKLGVLDLDGQLLHLCLHLARGHRFHQGLVALIDIAMLCRALDPSVNWARFADFARQAGASASAWTCLLLSCEVCGADVPPWVLDGLRPDRHEALRSAAFEQLWVEERLLPSLFENALVGGGYGASWVTRRLVLRHWGRGAGHGHVRRSAASLLGDLRHKLPTYRDLVRGPGSMRSFTARVLAARRRGRFLRMLARAEAIDDGD